MSARIDNTGDVVAFLTAQHEQIRAMFDKVMARTGSERTQVFVELRRLLAVHETAEEEIVHPRVKRELADGKAIVGDRLAEEKAAKRALAELEIMDIESTQFETGFRKLQSDVLAHATAEEQQEFPRLTEHLDTAQLERMRSAIRLAEAIAPTRPHAGVESPAANLLVGPFAAMLDRARDVISGHKVG